MLIEINNLSASYGKNIILDDISLDIHSGDSICILGENSSGKSTLLKCICKLKKYSGTIKYKKNIKIFYLPQDNILIDELSVEDNIKLLLRRYDKADYDNILSSFKIYDILKKKVSSLSGGTKRKISLCIALIEKNDILVLDESFVGLDTESLQHILDRLQATISRGTALVYTTHISDTTSIANRKFYLKNSKLEEKL